MCARPHPPSRRITGSGMDDGNIASDPHGNPREEKKGKDLNFKTKNEKITHFKQSKNKNKRKITINRRKLGIHTIPYLIFHF